MLISVLDACRTDRRGAYGYPRPTTPEIDALAADRDAVVFTRHPVSASGPTPATASTRCDSSRSRETPVAIELSPEGMEALRSLGDLDWRSRH